MSLRKKYGNLVGCLWQTVCQCNCERMKGKSAGERWAISLEYQLFQELLEEIEKVLEGTRGSLIESASEVTLSVSIKGDKFDVSFSTTEEGRHITFKKNGEIMEKFSADSCLFFLPEENNLPLSIDRGDHTIH